MLSLALEMLVNRSVDIAQRLQMLMVLTQFSSLAEIRTQSKQIFV